MFALGTEGGLVRQFVTALDEADALTHGLDGEVAVAFADTPRTGGMIQNGAVVFPAPSLNQQKAARWAEALAYRNARQQGTCLTPSGVVQIDGDSQRKITGAVQLAIIANAGGQTFALNWTMADNSVVALNAKAMIGLGVAVGEFVAQCQDAGTAIRLKIDAATDVDALQAIDITQGYPGAS